MYMHIYSTLTAWLVLKLKNSWMATTRLWWEGLTNLQYWGCLLHKTAAWAPGVFCKSSLYKHLFWLSPVSITKGSSLYFYPCQHMLACSGWVVVVWVVLVRGMATLHACKYGKYTCGHSPGAHGSKLASSIVSIRIVTLIKYRSQIDSKESTE